MINKRTMLYIMSLLILTMIGCASSSAQRTDGETAQIETSVNVRSKTFAIDFKRDINEQKSIIDGPSSSSKKAKAHLSLSFLYIDHRNPARDYGLALKELEEYEKLDPKGALDVEIQNLLGLLRDIRQLRSSIEKLKNLDMRIEEKRRQVQ